MENTVMHGSTIDVNQMQPQGKKRRMDWDSLDLNDSGSGGSGIGVVDSKIPNLVNNGKECERNRAKSVNGGRSRNSNVDGVSLNNSTLHWNWFSCPDEWEKNNNDITCFCFIERNKTTIDPILFAQGFSLRFRQMILEIIVGYTSNEHCHRQPDTHNERLHFHQIPTFFAFQ